MQNQPDTFDAIIVDPDTQTRMRLKQAMTSVVQFRKTHQTSSTEDATSKINAEPVDVCFLSSTLDPAQVDQFIATSKACKGGEDAAYIKVLKGSQQNSKSVADSVISGFDGILFEPYSVEQLVEITKLAARVRKERSGAREQAAFKILIGDLADQVNQSSFVKQQGIDPTSMLKKLRDSCATLTKLSKESVEGYLNVAVEFFSNAPMPTKVFQKKIYGGASKRLQKKQRSDIEDALKKLD